MLVPGKSHTTARSWRAVREGQGRVRRQGPPARSSRRAARPAFRMRRRAGGDRPGRTPSVDREDAGVGSINGALKLNEQTFQAPNPSLLWRRRPSAPRTSSGPRPTARRRDLHPTRCFRREPGRPAPASTPRQPEDGHPRVGLTTRRPSTTPEVPPRQAGGAEGHHDRGRAGLRRSSPSRAQRCERRQNCVHRRAASVRRLRRRLPDGLHHLHRQR